jgi:hypothetical protein
MAGTAVGYEGILMNTDFSSSMDRRSFLGVMAAGATLAPLALAGCGGTQQSDSTSSATETSAASGAATGGLSGQHLTFVGDDAFAPYRYIEMQSDGTQKVVGLDIAVADEMASRLGFTYDFEPQEFAATLASVQASDTSFTMAMSSNAEREQTYDFTRGYYQPLVGVLTWVAIPSRASMAWQGQEHCLHHGHGAEQVCHCRPARCRCPHLRWRRPVPAGGSRRPH